MKKVVQPTKASRHAQIAVVPKQRLAEVTGGHNGTIIVESFTAGGAIITVG